MTAPPSQRVRWGILGAASVARRRFVPALRQARNAEVVALASRNLESAQALGAELAIPKAYGSYEALLADSRVDAVYLPVPNSEHAKWALRCAEAGKAVLCEKPLALNAAEAEQVVNAFAKRGLLVMEGFMYRFHPQTDRVVELIRGGAIGALTALSAAFTFHLKAETNIRLESALGGGALLDVGSYCVSVMRLLVGEEPDQVRGSAVFGPSGVDVHHAGVLRFPSGVLGHFDCGIRGEAAQGYEIRGTEGRLTAERGFTMEPNEAPILRLWRGTSFEQEDIAPANHFVKMIEEFGDALLQSRPVRYPASDAVKNHRVLDALALSARG